MSEKEYNEQIRMRLLKYMEMNNKTRTDIAKYLNTNISTVSSWCNGARTPKMESIDRLCKLFGIKRSDLIGDGIVKEENHYYLDSETREYANELKNNKELRMLFDASRDASKEDLKTVYDMLLLLKKRERGDE